MRVQDLLRHALAEAHSVFAATMADVADEIRHHQHDGATIGSITQIYAHVIHSEDRLVQLMTRGQPLVWETAGFAADTGIDAGPPGPPDLAVYKRISELDQAILDRYAEAVFANTDAYVASADDSEMERVTDTFMGPMAVADILGRIVLLHPAHHTGEIAALKGLQGHVGLPY